MEPVVGIFPSRAAAERAAKEIHSGGFPGDRIELLLPGQEPLEAVVPTEDAESPGVGQAVGAVVGGATGASPGFGFGAVTATLLIPGIGAVTAVGNAAAALLGVLGAAGGAAAGDALEERSRMGVPRDDIRLYENALSNGKGVLFAVVENEMESEYARKIMGAAGAERLDAAGENGWAGIQEPNGARATIPASGSPVTIYRRGFLAALQPGLDGESYADALPVLRDRVGLIALSEAFQKGYAAGAALAKARAEDLGVAERK